jgi:hypothetical protein
MAKVTDVFLNGTIGNVVFYRRMGTQCARSRALHVNQSEATKIRSANFGIAARAGRVLPPFWRKVVVGMFSVRLCCYL